MPLQSGREWRSQSLEIRIKSFDKSWQDDEVLGRSIVDSFASKASSVALPWLDFRIGLSPSFE